jgi:diguanylate cyclase (GGDEF)-like protein/PAS domain S-box-containing protein
MSVASQQNRDALTSEWLSFVPRSDEDRYKALAEVLDSLPERVVRYRLPELTIVYCNASWAAWYNLEPAEVLGHTLDEFLSDDGRAGLASQLAVLSPDNPVVTDPIARVAPNRPGRWVEWVDRFLRGADGDEVLAVGRDITARHLAEVGLAESEARFRDLADKSTDILWHYISEPYPQLDYISPSVENTLGYTPEYLIEDFDRFLGILADADRAMVARAMEGEPMPDRCDFHYRHANGSLVIGEVQFTEVRGGLQGVVRDVTELRRLQESLAALALRDPLTGLANRRLFTELLEADLARTQRGGQPLAVAYLDLDNFKSVNDSFGHDAGDKVLCETANRLLSVVRGADVVARLGGDEFVIVYEPNDPSADKLIERTDAALALPIRINDSTAVRCPASIGVADTRATGYYGATLLAAADAAMYMVKRDRQRVAVGYDGAPVMPTSGRRDGVIPAKDSSAQL